MADPKDGSLFENGEKVPTLWGWHTYLSLLVALGILLFLATRVDLEKVWQEIGRSNKGLVLLGVLAHYATYPLRGARWRRCLIHLPIRGGPATFGLLVFFYNFVDNLVPAKLGDVYGGHLARINCGIRRSAALGSIVFLRAVDAWVVLILASLSSWVLFSSRLPQTVMWALIGGVVIAVATTSVIIPFLLWKRTLPGWLPEKVQQMVHAFRGGMWPRSSELIPVAALTCLIWVLETAWIYCLTLGFQWRIGPGEAVFLTMIPLLATAFPLTPSGVGVVELTLFGCLSAIGVPGSLAVSITVVNRFFDYWLHIGLGLVLWAIRKKVGLRTWREVPFEEFRRVPSLKTFVS
jgi:uncharacterized protein (TIRG00374 family)